MVLHSFRLGYTELRSDQGHFPRDQCLSATHEIEALSTAIFNSPASMRSLVATFLVPESERDPVGAIGHSFESLPAMSSI